MKTKEEKLEYLLGMSYNIDVLTSELEISAIFNCIKYIKDNDICNMDLENIILDPCFDQVQLNICYQLLRSGQDIGYILRLMEEMKLSGSLINID